MTLGSPSWRRGADPPESADGAVCGPAESGSTREGQANAGRQRSELALGARARPACMGELALGVAPDGGAVMG